MKVTDIPQISSMSTPEKILLVEDLWNSIILKELEVPVPESHKKELDKRFAKHSCSPGELLSLEELQDLIEKRK